MNKQTFLTLLRKGMRGLPKQEAAERLTFYSEMIDDRMEEGLSEEEAVGAIGDIKQILSQIRAEQPDSKSGLPQSDKKKFSAWEIVLLILGAPLWLSLLVAAFAVVLSLYSSLWAVIISLWAVWVSLLGCVIAGAAAGVVYFVGGHGITGIAMLGAGMMCAGLAVFLFYGCKAITLGAAKLTGKCISGCTSRMTRRRGDK